MKVYNVTLPVSGYCSIDVEADDEEDAINKALDLASSENLETWEAHRHLVRGNVCYAEVSSASAEEIEQ